MSTDGQLRGTGANSKSLHQPLHFPSNSTTTLKNTTKSSGRWPKEGNNISEERKNPLEEMENALMARKKPISVGHFDMRGGHFDMCGGQFDMRGGQFDMRGRKMPCSWRKMATEPINYLLILCAILYRILWLNSKLYLPLIGFVYLPSEDFRNIEEFNTLVCKKPPRAARRLFQKKDNPFIYPSHHNTRLPASRFGVC